MSAGRRLLLRLGAYLDDAPGGEGLPAAYARQLLQLLPPGSLWRLDPQSWLWALMLAISDEFARVDRRARDLVEEWFPNTATECLPDWERVLGLPDAAFGASATLAARRVAAETKYTARGGNSPAYYLSIAARMGFSAAYDNVATYTWRLAVNMAASGSTYPLVETDFRSGASRAGERVHFRGVVELEAVLRRLMRASTAAWFRYV